MRIENCKSQIVLIIVAVAAALAPGTLSEASGAAEQPFRYEDARLGELKDKSDKFKFVRIKISPMYPGACLGDSPCEPWSHDYPEAGIHFSKILSELSKLQVVLDEDEYIFSFADPNLMKYPFAYMCEVGVMQLNDAEIKGMREYLLRGGFLLVDDFRDTRNFRQMPTLQYYLKQALPEYEMKPLDLSHPIFNCFFSIKTLDVRSPYDRGRPEFLGVSDKNGRLMMVINFNNDVSDYWQWSGDPFQPLPAEDTQGAYKFGVNYAFYALTH
ncbi:MAG TPA: DUF4159 domain-containing protein [Blastocatellia bacterium]|nr:DUF4159 domain-containing protein [Blastocatellia bacterium]